MTPHKIFPYNVDSAKKELVGKPLWVKTGNVLPYYPYDAAAHTVNFKRKAGLLPPWPSCRSRTWYLQREPVRAKAGADLRLSRSRSWRYLKKRESRAPLRLSFGSNTGDDYTFTANESFFFEDPHNSTSTGPPIHGAPLISTRPNRA